MSSLGDIQQIYSMLIQIDKLLSNIEVKAKKTDDQLIKTVANAVILRRTLVQTARLLANMTGNEDLQNALNLFARAIMLINQLNVSLNLAMASNPLLWPLGVIGIIGMTVSAVDMAGSYT